MAGTLDYRTFFVVGMTLFLMTMVMNSASQWILARLGKVGAP
jgi:ABC-type phosphate transport system permease subunit